MYTPILILGNIGVYTLEHFSRWRGYIVCGSIYSLSIVFTITFIWTFNTPIGLQKRIPSVFLSAHNPRPQTSWIFRLAIQWWNTTFPSSQNNGTQTSQVYHFTPSSRSCCHESSLNVQSQVPDNPLQDQDSQCISPHDLVSALGRPTETNCMLGFSKVSGSMTIVSIIWLRGTMFVFIFNMLYRLHISS